MTAHATHTGGTSAGYSRWLLTCASHFHAVGACEGGSAAAPSSPPGPAAGFGSFTPKYLLSSVRSSTRLSWTTSEHSPPPAPVSTAAGTEETTRFTFHRASAVIHDSRYCRSTGIASRPSCAAIPGLPRVGGLDVAPWPWTVVPPDPGLDALPRHDARLDQRGASATIRAPRDSPATPARAARATSKRRAPAASRAGGVPRPRAPPPRPATRDAEARTRRWRAERMGARRRGEKTNETAEIETRRHCRFGALVLLVTRMFLLCFTINSGPSPSPEPSACCLLSTR